MRSKVELCLFLALGFSAAAQTQTAEEKAIREICPARTEGKSAKAYFDDAQSLFKANHLIMARCYWIASSDLGSPLAPSAVGYLYFHGVTVRRNLGEAFRWFMLSANRGFAPTQVVVGSMYERGVGVQQNHAEAVKWWKQAAAKGNEEAKKRLATPEKTFGEVLAEALQNAIKSTTTSAEEEDWYTGHPAGGMSQQEIDDRSHVWEKRRDERNRETDREKPMDQ